MAIRHWHRPKIVLLWVSYFLMVIITWAANVRINEFRVDLLSAELAWLWFFLFIPVFAVTWRWATGLEIASNFIQGEPLAPVGRLDPPRRSSFYATDWRKIGLVFIAATVGAAGGYWYKDFESHDIPGKWIEIRDNPDELSSRARFSVDHTASLKPHGIEIEVGNIETKVKFATARFNRTEDAELLYRGSLRTVISKVVLQDVDLSEGKLAHSLPDSVDLSQSNPERSIGTGAPPLHPGQLSQCEFYLTFSLYDKDNFFLVGLVGPRDTMGLMQEKEIEGTVEEVIPRQMARRTATIKRQVIFDKCT